MEIQPEFRIGIEIARQAQGGVDADAAPLVYDLTDAGGGQMKVKGWGRTKSDGTLVSRRKPLIRNRPGVQRSGFG